MDGYHIYFDTPTPIFKARVNAPTITYPVNSLPFDTVTLGAFGDIQFDMTLVIGSTEGGSDLGRVRVRGGATSDAISLSRVSRGRGDGLLDIQDNAYITVFEEYLPFPKIPFMTLDGETTVYKDGVVPVGTFMTEIPPISNPGPFFADYIDADTGLITVTLPMNSVNTSKVMAEGATLVSYAWDIADGTLVSGTLTDDVITVTFPAGKRWVSLTVVDSNGTPYTTRCFILAVDPDDDVTYQHWANATFEMEQMGQTLEVELNAPLNATDHPNGCLVLVWKDAPSDPSDRSHMKFVGWMRNETMGMRSSKRGNFKNTTVRCLDLANVLDLQPGFPQALQRPEDDDPVSWEFMPDLTFKRALHYIYIWHTTGMADFILPESVEGYPFMRLDAPGSSLYDQLNSLARKLVPRHVLTCNPQGQLVFVQDWMEIDAADRPASFWGIAEQDIAELQVKFSRQSKVHMLTTGAFKATTTWLEIGGVKDLEAFYSRAPGDSYGFGTTEAIEGEGLALTQDDLNVATGHRFERMNAMYEPFPISLASRFDYWQITPSLFKRVQLTVSPSFAAQRWMDFETAEGQVKSMTVRLTSNKRGMAEDVDLSWEKETEGYAGVTHHPEATTKPDDTEVPRPPETTPPGATEGEDLVALIGQDGFVYRTSNFQSATPTWTRVDLSIAETIYSWTVDPFSPKYLTGSGAVNGWIATDSSIYRITDLFGSPAKSAVAAFDEATDPDQFHWRTVQASFGAYFAPGVNPWLVCVSYYASLAGHEGTWARYSTDAGATWSDEVQLADGTLLVPPRFMPVAVYASPRTPGLAYAVAYVQEGEGIPEEFLPLWGKYGFGYTPIEIDAELPTTFGLDITNHATVHNYLMPYPPEAVIRVKLAGYYDIHYDKVGLIGGFVSFEGTSAPNVSVVDGGTGASGDDADLTGVFEMEWTLTSGNWPVSKEEALSTPPTSQNNPMVDVAAFADGATVSRCILSSMIVLEIETEDNVVYTAAPAIAKIFRTTNYGLTWEEVDGIAEPGYNLAGTLHFPWQANVGESKLFYGALESTSPREFRLKKNTAGVITDISPVSAAINYGVNRGPFGIRTFDGEGGEVFLLAACVGNDTSEDGADDQHALFISDDEGETWAEVIAPFADSGAPTNRPALEAAFSGASEQQIFIWGPPNFIKYSDDFGATVNDKSGNIVALGGCPGVVGIAGGSS